MFEVVTLMNSDNVSKGTAGTIYSLPGNYNNLTCDVIAYGDNITVLSVAIQGSLGKWWDNSSVAFDNASIGRCDFTSAQITQKTCSIYIVDKPVNLVRVFIDNLTQNLDNGTATARANNVRVYCGGL